MKRRVLNIVITGAIIIVSFVLQSYLSLVSGQSFVVPKSTINCNKAYLDS